MANLTEYMLPCQYKAVLDIDCPMCGAQRSLELLLQGDVYASVVMFPPLLIVLAWVCAALLSVVGRNWVDGKYIRRSGYALLAIVLVNYMLTLLT